MTPGEAWAELVALPGIVWVWLWGHPGQVSGWAGVMALPSRILWRVLRSRRYGGG